LEENGVSYIFGPGTRIPDAAVSLLKDLVKRLKS
jgi:methylmalonyl-CoA mutase cobalamin-binding subunit